jgi:hypothetical protein
LTEAARGIKRSEKDSKIDFKLLVAAVSCVILLGIGVYLFLYSSVVLRVLKGPEDRIMPTTTPFVVGGPMDAFATLTPPSVVERQVINAPSVVFPPITPFPTVVPVLMPTVDIAATVSALVDDRLLISAPLAVPAADVIKEFVEVPVERVITQTVYIGPTPTPVLPPGMAKVCIYVEGVTGVYFNETGIVGNTCIDYPVTALVNDIKIKITR